VTTAAAAGPSGAAAASAAAAEANSDTAGAPVTTDPPLRVAAPRAVAGRIPLSFSVTHLYCASDVRCSGGGGGGDGGSDAAAGGAADADDARPPVPRESEVSVPPASAAALARAQHAAPRLAARRRTPGRHRHPHGRARRVTGLCRPRRTPARRRRRR